MLLGTQLKYCWLPKRCYTTKKIIWFKKAYKQTHIYTGPGDPVYSHIWFSVEAYLVNKLKGIE